MQNNIYCVSDIHNDYDKFIRLLQKIKFCDRDLLYIAGDLFDRGNKPLELYREIKKYKNIIPILGNHDRWLADYIINNADGKKSEYPYNSFALLKEQLSEKELYEIADWINTFPKYLIVSVDGTQFLLAHARTFEDPDEVSEQDLIVGEVDFAYLKNGIDNYISVIGHVPTDLIRCWMGAEAEKSNTIWINRKRNVCCIDCGCSFPNKNNRLGCLRLNDFECFYV